MDETSMGDAGASPVAGRYRLLTLVGSGGMGRVWRARDELLDRVVAVKELVPPAGQPVASRSTAQLATMREARAAARLRHPGVVHIYDVVHAIGRMWIVMEYVESSPLSQRLLRDGPLPHREAARIGLAVLEALRAAHAYGVVHHDVKPANVLLAADGRVMLTDFGLATLDAAPAHDGARTAPLLGSPHYVAPERLRGGVSDERGDLWSLGATLYTVVEGRPPFDRPTVAESLAAVLDQDPDPPRHPGPLHPAIAALMARDPAARFTAAQAYGALHTVLHRAVGISAVPAPRPPGGDEIRFRPAAAPAAASPAPARPPRPPRRKRLVAVSATAAVLTAAGSAVAWNAIDRPGTEPSNGAPSPAGTTAAFSTDTCRPASRQPLNAMPEASATPAVPGGWRWHRDPAGFLLATPPGWTRSQRAGVICIGAPDGSRTLTVRGRTGPAVDPSRHWQNAERAAVTGRTLPGYQRVSMGVLLMTGGAADWEYTWTPAAGPRLHTRRVLLSAAGPHAYELMWTTAERDWTAGLSIQKDLVSTFRDASAATPTWGVPAPQ